MKRLIAFLLFALSLSAQVKQLGPVKVAGASKQTFGAAASHTFSFTSTANTHCSSAGGSSTPQQCTLGATVPAGSLVLLTVITSVAVGTVAVSDGASCTAAKTTSNGSSGANDATAGTAFLFFFSATSGCAATWAATYTSGTFFGLTVNVITVSPNSTVLQDGGDVIGSGTTGTAINTPTVPNSTTGDLQVCFAASENAATSANAPWTSAGTGPGGDWTEIILSSTTNQACNFTQNSGHWDTIGAAFK